MHHLYHIVILTCVSTSDIEVINLLRVDHNGPSGLLPGCFLPLLVHLLQLCAYTHEMPDHESHKSLTVGICWQDSRQ